MIVRHKTCKPHKFQDKWYGNKCRVVNKTSHWEDRKEVRCTVCGKTFNKGDK